MTYFVGVAPLGIRSPVRDEEAIRLAFTSPLRVSSLPESPFSSALCGQRSDRSGHVVTVGSSSRDVVGLGREGDSCLGAFIQGVRTVADAFGGCTVLLHWFRSEILAEEIALRSNQTVVLSQLGTSPIEIEEDVRYTFLA